MQRTIERILQKCMICAKNNSKTGTPPPFMESKLKGEDHSVAGLKMLQR